MMARRAAGGGIYAGGDLIVENSTISRNLSYGAVADGGGLFALGDVMISNSTMVIPPFLMGLSRRIHAAVFSFMAGVIPPIAMLGRSLLYVQSHFVA